MNPMPASADPWNKIDNQIDGREDCYQLEKPICRDEAERRVDLAEMEPSGCNNQGQQREIRSIARCLRKPQRCAQAIKAGWRTKIHIFEESFPFAREAAIAYTMI